MDIRTELHEIAWAIAEHGIDDDALRAVLLTGARLGVNPVALGVLADTAAPFAARCRAFDKVSAGILAVVEDRPSFVLAA